jgi:hypothetical protein
MTARHYRMIKKPSQLRKDEDANGAHTPPSDVVACG